MAYKEPLKPCDVNKIISDTSIYFDKLNEESDRGVILASADLLDWHLKVLARQRLNLDDLVGESKKKEFLKSFFSNQGMIGTFSNAIKFCYGLDLIGISTYESLEAIRGIRNDAAHTFSSVSFNAESISSRIEHHWKNQEFLDEKIKTSNNIDLEYNLGFGIPDYSSVATTLVGSPIRIKFIEQVFNADMALISTIHHLSKTSM